MMLLLYSPAGGGSTVFRPLAELLTCLAIMAVGVAASPFARPSPREGRTLETFMGDGLGESDQSGVTGAEVDSNSPISRRRPVSALYWDSITPGRSTPNWAELQRYTTASKEDLYAHIADCLDQVMRNPNRPTFVDTHRVRVEKMWFPGQFDDLQLYILWYNTQKPGWRDRLPPVTGQIVTPQMSNSKSSGRLTVSDFVGRRLRLSSVGENQREIGILISRKLQSAPRVTTFAAAFMIRDAPIAPYGPPQSPYPGFFAPVDSPTPAHWPPSSAGGWGPGFEEVVDRFPDGENQVLLALEWLAEGGSLDDFIRRVVDPQAAQQQAQSHLNAQAAEAMLLEAYKQQGTPAAGPERPGAPGLEPAGGSPDLVDLLRAQIATQGQQANLQPGAAPPTEQTQDTGALLRECLGTMEEAPPSSPVSVSSGVSMTVAELEEFTRDLLDGSEQMDAEQVARQPVTDFNID